MSLREQVQDIREEMEKDFFDLLEQVIVLLLGGVLGGQALSITRADFPLHIELIYYLILLGLGLFTLGTIHFLVSHHRVRS